MGPAAWASMVMAPIHCLFGLHIVRRGVIFIDLAIAQIAALGTTVAVLAGHEAGTPAAHWMTMGFALVGALMISLSRFKLARVPHEAMIGIFFVLASALGIILLENTAHGAEELKNLLAGSILLVGIPQVQSTAIVYAVILGVLLIAWRPITAISLREADAPDGAKAVLLDFLFYAMLALVVSYSVQIAGVLVVFTWLVMPAVTVYLWAERMLPAVAISLPLAAICSIGGLWLSFSRDLPTGSTMVVVMGAVVGLSYLVRLFTPTRPTA